MNTCISPKARGQRMNTTITTATTVFDLFRASDVETLRYNFSGLRKSQRA